MVLALLPAFQLAGGQAGWESGDQDELSADMAALADAVGLGGAAERERLHLDHQVVLGQQSGDLGQRLHGPAVRIATGHPGPGLAGGEVGDGHYLGWLGYQADQLPGRGLARDVEHRVDGPAGRGPDAGGHALAVQHRDRPDLPQVVLVGLARRRAPPPTPPPPRSTKILSPPLTPSRRRPRSLVPPATPAAAATAQSMDGGLAAQASSTAYSACVFWPRPNTSSPSETPVTPSPTSSTTPAAS